MKKLLLTILFSLFLSGNAYSFYNYGEYKNMKKSDLKSLNEYIDGLGSGLRFATINQKEWCVPENLRLNTNNYFSIIDDYAKRSNAPDDELVVALLFYGFKTTFPCK
jgi:hypothetical protein